MSEHESPAMVEPFRLYADVAVVVAVLVVTNLLAHFTTPWASVATVPVAAAGL
ncbi:MAG: CPBP family intramembrane metalloprotease, partial [Mycobacterium sp.]|nr:CPBP family intramembrane metalloprotease [Mycobacterium sp.]